MTGLPALKASYACCSEERARRISSARSERAEDYRFSRMAHAARQQLEQREAAAAEAGEAGLAQRPEVAVLVKADVQVRTIWSLPFVLQLSLILTAQCKTMACNCGRTSSEQYICHFTMTCTQD